MDTNRRRVRGLNMIDKLILTWMMVGLLIGTYGCVDIFFKWEKRYTVLGAWAIWFVPLFGIKVWELWS